MSRAFIVSLIVEDCAQGDAYFDALAWLAAQALSVARAHVTLLDDTTSWRVGHCGGDEHVAEPLEGSISERLQAGNRAMAIGDSDESAWAGSPIRGLREEVLGTVCVIDTAPRTWTEEQRRVLDVLAACAQAEVLRRVQLIEWRRLETSLAATADARQLVESRAVRIAALTRRLGSCVTVDDVAAAIVDVGAVLLEAAFVTVATADLDLRALVVRCSTGDATINEPGGRSTIPIDEPTPLCDALRSGQPVVLVDDDQRASRYPGSADDAAAAGMVTTVALPLRAADGATIGVLGLGWPDRIELSVAQWALLDTTAELCAQTMQRCELADARRDLVVSLQRELLPHVSSVKGLDIAVRYTPARHELGFGGDWYDVVVIDSARTAFIVGDVCGHGVRAAARMAEIRSTVSALVRLLPDDLGSVLDRAEVMLGHFDDPFIATVAIIVVDPANATLSFVSAGHPPPVLVQPDGSWVTLEGGRRAVLGAGGTGSVAPGHADFVESAVFAAFTDGLVERRDRSLDDGIHELATGLCDDRGVGIDHLAAAVVKRLGDHPHDDVAIVVVRANETVV